MIRDVCRVLLCERASAEKRPHRAEDGSSLDTVTTASSANNWSLDALGNWSSTGSQTRTFNSQNQITAISGLTTPAYNNDGDMTKDQAGTTYTFDAWNRIIFVASNEHFGYLPNSEEASQTFCGCGTPTNSYYSINWQVLEDQTNSGVCGAMATNSQYVWGLGYIDDLVERDRNADNNLSTGSLGINSSGDTLSNDDIYGNLDYGVFLGGNGNNNWTITGSRIHDQGGGYGHRGYGISTTGDIVTVSNNTVFNNPGNGIDVEGSSTASSISGNTVYANVTGIVAVGGTVTGNIVHDNSSTGIYGGDGALVSGNTVYRQTAANANGINIYYAEATTPARSTATTSTRIRTSASPSVSRTARSPRI